MPFPNLDSDTTPTESDPPAPAALEPARPAPFADRSETTGQADTTPIAFRVDNIRAVVQKLQLDGVDDLMTFLSHDWAADAYIAYHDKCLRPAREADQAYIEQHHRLPPTQQGRGQHQWKIDRVAKILQSKSSQFFDKNPDTGAWDDHDHEIHFMVQIVRNAVAPGRVWAGDNGVGCTAELSQRALCLTEFLRWVYKFNIGTSQETEKTRNRKKEWLRFLEKLREDATQSRTAASPSQDQAFQDPDQPPESVPDGHDGHDDGGSRMNVDPTAEPSHPSSTDSRLSATPEVMIPGEDIGLILSILESARNFPAEATATTTSSADSDLVIDEELSDRASLPDMGDHSDLDADAMRGHPVFNYKIRQSKTSNQQKGIHWLTEDAYKVFKNNLEHRLNSWGLSADGRGTCILVPAEWANVRPQEIMDDFRMDSWPNDEAHTKRLASRPDPLLINGTDCAQWLHIADHTATWARACGWFSAWPDHPRRGIDLDQFVAGPRGVFPEMHGSHLCHHGLCIQPGHIVYEDRITNLSRNSCHTAAKTMRGYHNSVPEHCSKHDPPCLLQVSAAASYVTTTPADPPPARLPDGDRGHLHPARRLARVARHPFGRPDVDQTRQPPIRLPYL